MDEGREPVQHRRVREQRVSHFHAGALAVHFGPRVGLVHLNHGYRAGEGDLHVPLTAGIFEASQHVVVDSNGREVILAGLEHGSRGRNGVAPALDLERVEEGAVGDVVVRVQISADDVARLEVGDSIRPSSDGTEIFRSLSRLGTLERLEHVAGENEPPAAPLRRPVSSRTLEDESDRMTVELLDPFKVLGDSQPWGARRRICGVLPGEHDVVRGERLPIVPGDAGLKLPGDGEAVARDATVLDAGNLPGEDRSEEHTSELQSLAYLVCRL